MSKLIVDRIHDPLSENDGLWYVGLVDDDGKLIRILFRDRYKSVCTRYVKLFKTEKGND